MTTENKNNTFEPTNEEITFETFSKNIDEFLENGEFIKNVDAVLNLKPVREAQMLPLDFRFLYASLTSKTLTVNCKKDLLNGARKSILKTLESLAINLLTLRVTENGFENVTVEDIQG